MPTWDSAVATSMPYVLCMFLQFADLGVRQFARRGVRMITPKHVHLPEETVNICVESAMYTYVHVSFLAGATGSVITCFAYMLIGRMSGLTVCMAGALFVMSLLLWALKWQDLRSIDLTSARGRWMRIWSLLAIVVPWIMAIVCA